MLLETLRRCADRFRGDGEAAVSLPAWDGAFKPNALLDEAEVVWSGTTAADLVRLEGRLAVATRNRIEPVDGRGAALVLPGAITATAHSPSGECLAVAIEGREVLVLDRQGRVQASLDRTAQGTPLRCVNALCFEREDTVLVSCGSAHHEVEHFAHDLLEHRRSGSLHRWQPATGTLTRLADRLQHCFGATATPNGDTLIAESWAHRLQRLHGGSLTPVLDELPGYPSRLTRSARGGYWLTLFCARTQLLEFVLREDGYRTAMMREIDPRWWIAPALATSNDYREPLQGAGIRQMGVHKPWAPPRSYGLVAYLDETFMPRFSLHSRADGRHHGIVAAMDDGRDLLVLSAGAARLLRIDARTLDALLEGSTA